MPGAMEHFCGIALLLEFTKIHHSGFIGEVPHQRKVVCDE
jgi:hypothetical protein